MAMREAHPRERAVGMEYYVSDADGVGGELRATPEAFAVRELERFETEPLDADPGSYPCVVFRATLRNWDTNDFAARLADDLGVSRERFSWAGTKDKRAVTTQLFSVRGVDPDDLPEVDGADVAAIGRAGRDIEFGDLAGNAFEIGVHEPEAPENARGITAELAAFAGGEGSDGADADDRADGPIEEVTVGVPNFFGQQRFGSRRPITHEVGLALARGEWREAVLAYVGSPFESEPEATQAARAFVEEQAGSPDPDWAGALDRMPGALGYERSMLHRLQDAGADAESSPEVWREALERVPSNLQRLFVHAAQSYAYNLMLSERLRRGLPFDRPVAGDVVCFADRDAPEGLALPDTDRLQRVTEERVDTVTRHCERGRAFVTAPLVGTESDLGDGDPGGIERDVLENLGLSKSDFDLPGNFESTGDRRAILLRTDLDVTFDPLTFAFSLPKGSYATVVLREYLKGDPIAL
jgi:tRNA pseudouridine13 synthase